jgi:biotin carboxyl carrier protein
MTVRVLVNGKPVVLSLSREGNAWAFECDGRRFHAEVLEPEKNVYLVLIDGKSFEARVSGDRVQVGGHDMVVALEDPRDVVGGGAGAALQGRQSIVAPMPGKVVRVLVSEGDEVQRDQGIVVIEAMKMQNEMKSPKAGRVVSLAAQQGATVVSGEVLAVVE